VSLGHLFAFCGNFENVCRRHHRKEGVRRIVSWAWPRQAHSQNAGVKPRPYYFLRSISIECDKNRRPIGHWARVGVLGRVVGRIVSLSPAVFFFNLVGQCADGLMGGDAPKESVTSRGPIRHRRHVVHILRRGCVEYAIVWPRW
jgi:hypothetical protein